MAHWELLLFFGIIAFVYASVGFGGGSSYLAILSLYAIPMQEMRLTALICNIIVVTGGTLVFIRQKQVVWRKILPLVVISVPMSFLGACIRLKENDFFILLGCSLIAAGILLWIRKMRMDDGVVKNERRSSITGALMGGAIGFLSGMVGIGGGIFLSPVLNLTHWDTPRRIAATASLFILVNSIAGIAGQLTSLHAQPDYKTIGLLAGAVLIGGQSGSRLGSVKFSQLIVRRITAMLVFIAGIEVLYRHLPIFK